MDPHRMGRTLTLNHHPRAAATRRGQTHISAANPRSDQKCRARTLRTSVVSVARHVAHDFQSAPARRPPQWFAAPKRCARPRLRVGRASQLADSVEPPHWRAVSGVPEGLKLLVPRGSEREVHGPLEVCGRAA